MNQQTEKTTHFGTLPSMTLAHATVAMLKFQSVNIDVPQLISGLPASDEILAINNLERAIKKLGHKAIWGKSNALKNIETPCCIALNDGGYAVVVKRDRSMYNILCSSSPDAYQSVTVDALQSQYAKAWFQILPTTDLLLKTHAEKTAKGHWFWSRLLLEKSRLFDIITSSLLANILAVVTSLFALQVYDRVIPGQSEATLWVLASGVCLGILFEAILRMSRSNLIDRMGREAEVEISSDLYQKVADMRLDKRPAAPAGVVQMVREFSAVKEFFTTASVGVVADLPFVFIFLGLIYGIAGSVVWIVLVGAILIMVPSFFIQGRMAQLSKETMGGSSAAARILTETTYGLEAVKASRMQPLFQKRWEEITALNAEKTTEQRGLSAFQTYWATAIQQVTYVAALIAGVYLVFEGELTVGAIIAVSILSTRTLSPVTQLSGVLTRWQNMKLALFGLDQIMESDQDRDPNKQYFRRPRMVGSITFRKTKFAHLDANFLALDIENYHIPRGTRLALLGANGSGKSTLLRMISGICHPTEGELLLDGVDIRQIDPDDLRRNVGYLPQEVRLFSGTLRENLVGSSMQFTDLELMDALTFGGLADHIKKNPEGLDLKIADGGEGLSIGQRQSVGLARLFLQDPSILLMDEPTAALDQTLENALVQKLDDWIGTRTCIIATHRPQILSQIDRIAILKNGRLALENTRDVVLDAIKNN